MTDKTTTDCDFQADGFGDNSTFAIWSLMVARCTYPDNYSWKHYGARGITVCDRWRRYSNFLADMGCKPEGRSLDRINNNGPYSPENCRWATPHEQARNTRRNRFVVIDGSRMTHSEAARLLGIDEATMMRRVDRGAHLAGGMVSKVTDSQRLEIIALSEAGRNRKEVALMYGLTPQGVSHIVCRAIKYPPIPEDEAE